MMMLHGGIPFIRNLQAEGQQNLRARATKDKVHKEFFNIEYFCHCKQSPSNESFLFIEVKLA